MVSHLRSALALVADDGRNHAAGPTTAQRRILIGGGTSGLLYVLLYVAQRAVDDGSGGAVGVGLALYLATTVGLFAVYLWVLARCRRPLPTRVRLLALGLPSVTAVAWLLAAPVFSSDVLSYIAHGYVQVGFDGNPYVVSSKAVAGTEIGEQLGSYGWRPVPPTPYGPVFTHLEVGVVRLTGGDVPPSIVLFKLAAVVSFLGAGALIWWILDRVRPQDRDLGTVAFLWNPAVLVEAAGEGHNDALMAALVLLSLGLTLRRRVTIAAIVTALAATTKYVPLLLVPLQVAYLVRETEQTSRFRWQLATGAIAGALLTCLVFAPFWVGWSTLSGLGQSSRAGHTGSTQTMLVEVLSRVVDEPVARSVVAFAALAAIGLLTVVLAARVRDGRGMLRSSAIVAAMAMVFLGPAYWPWYVILPVALLALVPEGRLLVALVAMSLGARLVAPLNSLYLDGVVDRAGFLLLTWLGAVAMPLVVVLLASRLVDFREVVAAAK